MPEFRPYRTKPATDEQKLSASKWNAERKMRAHDSYPPNIRRLMVEYGIVIADLALSKHDPDTPAEILLATAEQIRRGRQGI
jgi:hypothetical protein